MKLNVKRMSWMGNIYQKFEAVCQEVDDIVGQDAVKYLENRVQNVGDSVKKLYSEVVHELLPFPTLASPTKYEAHYPALKNNVSSSVKSVGSVEGKDKKGVEENPVNNFIESSQDSNAIDQQAGALGKLELVNQVSGETCSDSLEVEDSFMTQEEVGDDSRETSGVEQESLHASIEETAIKSAPELMNLISVKEKKALEFSMHSQSYFSSSDRACGESVRRKDINKVNAEQDTCLIIEENSMNSSTAEVLNFTSVGETELIKTSLFNELSDVDKDDTDIVAEVSPAGSSVSCERTGSFVVSDCPFSESNVCCESPQVAGQVKESHDGVISNCRCQSMKSNDESHSKPCFEDIQLNNDTKLEESMEDIQLNNDTKLEERRVFVDDSELHAVVSRIQKRRSYKKRIQDAFTSKKKLAKEYEQLAIWYGDADIEPSPLFPFSSNTCVNSKNLQAQQASEIEWELL